MTISAEHKDELIESRNQSFTTHRSTVPALEDILCVPLPVLDHGFVRVVDYMGDDAAVVQAARVSYGRGTKKSLQDQGLINYLMSHRHTTPFEMCEIKYHLKLPIFIARQWIRHRTASVNEYSARYSILNKEFYVPAPEHLAVQSTVNRQGRTDTLTGEESARVLDLLRRDAELVYEHYQEMLNADEHGQILDANRSGLTRELARINLTLNYYTEWYWKIDLHNLMHFLSLRADHHAQYEIRAYAEVMLDTVAKWVPKSFAAFKKYKMNAMLISEPSIRLIKQLIKGQKICYDDADMSKREWQEFLQAFDIEMAE